MSKNEDAKGIFGEVLFNDFLTKSTTFKQELLNKISKITGIKFNKNNDLKLYWKNEKEESGKPLDFEFNIKDVKNRKYTFQFDIKYSTNGDFVRKQLHKNWIDKCIEQEKKENKTIYFFYLIYSPNFEYKPKKGNFITWTLEQKNWRE